MFIKKQNLEKTLLDKTIEDLHAQMDVMTGDSPEYGKMTDNLKKLYILRAETTRKVSPDTLANIAANLTGIILILNYERAGVVASKALGFLKQLR